MRILLSLFFCIIALVGCTYNNVNRNNDNYNATALSREEENFNNISNNTTNTSLNNTSTSTPVEVSLSAFSTKVSQKDPDRQTNITITCQSLNGTIVKAGETFSFCNTLGPAKPENGYKKADTFDSDGNTIQAYGGGKCQVSTTLYNAVLACSGLNVVERHEHSGDVFYVPEGMDACVAYGSCDFKFKNENNFDIKLYISNTPDSIDVSIVKISS